MAKPRKRRTIDPRRNLDYGSECIVVRNGTMLNPTVEYQIRVPAYPTECDYVRLVRVAGEDVDEIAYWNSDEWQHDPDHEAIGAVMGAITQVAMGVTPDIAEPARPQRRARHGKELQ